MRPESLKLLHDMREAGRRVLEFTRGRTLADYRSDALLRSAVERQFEIIGEALSQLSKIDRETAEQIPERRGIISFRNILIHSYAAIDETLVWGVVESKLPEMLRTIDLLLNRG
ncbi:MAG: HepT-like ribonuclease domain-containing protein [Planctomycetota bacterium]